MTYGLPWSEQFICQLENKEYRDEFVADQIRTRIALMVRSLREDEERGWSQAELGQRMSKPQNVVSRLEDPDYGRMSLSTLLEVAAAFDLPLWIDIPAWGDWLRKVRMVPDQSFVRNSFDKCELKEIAKEDKKSNWYNVNNIRFDEPTKSTFVKRRSDSDVQITAA